MPLTVFVLHLKVQLYLSQHCTPHSLILPLPDPTLPPEFIWFYSFRFFPARILRWSVLICMHLHNECHLHARGQTIPWERLCCLFVCACVFMHGHMCVLVRVQHILSTSKLQYLTKQKTNNKPLGAVCFFGLFYAGTVQSLCLTRWRRSILASLNCTPPIRRVKGHQPWRSLLKHLHLSAIPPWWSTPTRSPTSEGRGKKGRSLLHPIILLFSDPSRASLSSPT